MNTRKSLLLTFLLWAIGSAYCMAQVEVVNTIFIADYENNQTNSGFPDLNPTNAPASDAVYMVAGDNSNYAVAHKVDRTDSEYFSNGAYRSESSTLDFSAANYLPGDHQRYEFSLYLKDWEEYTPGATPHADNIFQMKETGGTATRIAIKRNGLFVWDAESSQNELINDVRPYVNQWIDFRIDVLWKQDATGYIKYYIRLPGETSYTLVRSVQNIINYFGTAIGGQRGYSKWGVYREADPNSVNTPVTRIAYHDNVKLFELDFVLPVELQSFSGKVFDAREIHLTWQTASELNNEKFEIEESRDGREFYKIGEVKGKGTTFEQQYYSFEIKKPKKGISYYRLKQFDRDGQFEYSESISVNLKEESGQLGECYPNPSKSGLVNLDYFAQNEDEITVLVFDMAGKLVFSQIKPISNGSNNLSFNFLDFNTGVYIIKIGNEINQSHQKIIIER